MDLVDRQSGATVAVPEQDAIPALQSGKFGVMPGQKVPVVRDGQVGTVPAEQLGSALKSGIRLAAPDEVHKAETELKYGDRIAPQIPGIAHLATSVAALRGATAGLSDPAVLAGARWLGGQELEGKTREALVGLKEANPWRTLGGEVAGMVAGSAALPNTSPIGQIGKLGGAVEGAVTGQRAATFGGRLLQSALSYGARGAVEGGAIGAGYAASDAALEDKELTGEKLLAGARGGALAGAALGAGTGATGEILGAGARKLGEAASGAMKGESVAEALEGFAGKKMFKGAGPLIRDERAAAKFAGGGEEVGRIFNRELETAGKSKIQSAEALGEFATEHADKLGAELGDMRAALDKLPDAQKYQPRVADLINVAMKEIGTPLAQKPMFEADAAAFGKALESVGVSTGYLKPGGAIANPEARVSFEGFNDIRKALSDKAYRVSGNTPSLNPSPHIDDLRQLKGLWEEEFTKAAENAAQGENPAWREGYEGLKRRYQATRIISDITKDAELRGNRNNTLGLTDYVLSAGALATGHPVGAVATAFGNKIAKGYGNQILASLASDLAKTKFLQRAGSNVDRSLIDGVRGLLGEGARTAVDATAAEAGARAASSPPRLAHLPLSAYDREVNDAQSAATNPRAHVLRAAQEFEGIEGHDPELFNALVQKSQRAAEFLASKVPKGTVDARSLTPHLEKPIVSDAEKAEFLTYVRAVRNPMSVVADLKNGSLVPEEVEALRAVYPKIFARLREMVGAGLREATKKPSYQATIRLGILFDTPTDATLDPMFVHAVQGTYGPDEEAEHPAAGMPPPGMDLQLGQGMATQSDARMMR